MVSYTLDEGRLIQKTLRENLRVNLTVDGYIGPASRTQIVNLQKKLGYEQSGVVTGETKVYIDTYAEKRFITMGLVSSEAKLRGIDPSVALAIASIESRGFGFLPSGRILILFEGHQFYAHLAKKYGAAKAREVAAKYPKICYQTWTKAHYLGYEREYERLAIANSIDVECALKSTSFGIFQLMGFNYACTKEPNVGDFVEKMTQNEFYHLKAFFDFISVPKMLTAIKNRNIDGIASFYNGSGYKANGYDVKLRNFIGAADKGLLK